ncbi:hypothetical protein WISP_34070 [Willisornis vidua]|uniref:Uncharacterized protein n=1 Tax=Willisornis vidua TaxID=1566151 RepID=A0ABQ9DPX4_9PASS|nr:hypothetical protein WISP_34070 [Willisornis vidua]
MPSGGIGSGNAQWWDRTRECPATGSGLGMPNGGIGPGNAQPRDRDLEKESDTPLQQVSIEEILEEQREELQAKQESEKLKVQALKERGLSVPRADTLDEY